MNKGLCGGVRIRAAAAHKPEIAQHVTLMLGQYMQARHSFASAAIWSSRLGAQSNPTFEEFQEKSTQAV
jgi:hypothetical protein